MNPLLWDFKSRLNRDFLKLVLVSLSIMQSSCFVNPSPPELTTKQIELIDFSTIVSGGNISDDGGTEVFQKGICVSLENTPTMQDLFTLDGIGNAFQGS